MEFIKKIKPNQKAILFLSLCFLFGAWSWVLQSPLTWALYFFSTLAFTFFWSKLLSLRWDRPFVVETDAITALILMLIIMPPLAGLASYSFVSIWVAIVLALTWKRLVRWKMSPVFNPAAVGLILTALGTNLIFGKTLFYAWWGTAFLGPFGVLWMLMWILFFLNTWRKREMAFMFIGVNLLLSVLYCVVNQHMSAQEMFLYMIQNATMYFFAGWMLVEPKTSPMLLKDQGLVVLGSSFLYWVAVHFAVDNSLLWALLFANFITLILKVYRSRKGLLRAQSAPVEGSHQS